MEPYFDATSLTFAVQVLTFPRAVYIAVTTQSIARFKPQEAEIAPMMLLRC